jgi:hypothetical protein
MEEKTQPVGDVLTRVIRHPLQSAPPSFPQEIEVIS